jgi:ethanolamine ammonia-lyase small subunit
MTKQPTSAPALVVPNPWQDLRQFTAARIALGRVGASLPTDEVLRFGLAHAQARDAVHLPLDVAALEDEVRRVGFATTRVTSCAGERARYLLRPDLGRTLAPESAVQLRALGLTVDVAFVIGDGLSAIAVQRHAAPLLDAVKALLHPAWRPAPVVIATQARVALGDAIGECLNAQLMVMLIGERPGLSSPDSLGAYITYQPRNGRTDAERNCISNIRPQGLKLADAAHKLAWLMHEALQRRLTGVGLKDSSEDTQLLPRQSQ